MILPLLAGVVMVFALECVEHHLRWHPSNNPWWWVLDGWTIGLGFVGMVWGLTCNLPCG